jgi:hypothetical protein
MNTRWRAGVVLAAILAGPAQAAGLQDVAFLAGHWGGEQRGLRMEELWTAPDGGTLLGLHRDVARGRTVSWEFLRIEEKDGVVTYWASPGGAVPTPFRLVESGANRAVFENRAHDFPQRILYWLDTEGRLHARVEGPASAPEKAMEWTWTRLR